jgi:hypothetical protein
MYALLLLAVLAQDAANPKPKIEEIQVSDLDETITLRADGTAEYRFRGRSHQFVRDERVGFFTANFPVRKFHRIAALLADVDIDGLKDHRLPFPESISHLNIVRGGSTKHLEIHDRRVAADPEPPDRLWTLIMVVRGFGTTLHWEPIKSGLKVRFKGPSDKDRFIVVREPVSHIPIVAVHSKKELIEFPIKPGVYSVEYQVQVNGTWSDALKTPATVEENEMVEVTVEK